MPIIEKPYNELITFTRNSTATYFDEAGILRTAAVNEPRFDYDPVSHVLKGQLVEGVATNAILYSESLDNSWWRKRTNAEVNPNVGTGAAAGYEEILNSVSSGRGSGIYSNTSILETSNRTVTTTVFLASKTGNTTATIFVGGYSGNDQANDKTISFEITTTPIRVQITNTWANHGIIESPYVEINPGEIGVPILASKVQMEYGPVPTSYIPTTTAPVTRAADELRVNVEAEFFDAEEGTIYLEHERAYDNFNNYPRSLGSDTGGQAVFASTGITRDETWNGSVSLAGFLNAEGNEVRKQGLAFSPSGRSICVNGGNIGTDANLFQVVNNSFRLMANGNNSTNLNGWVKNMKLWRRRLTDAELIDQTSTLNPMSLSPIVYLEPEDNSVMSQTSEGGTPVTSNNQQIGFIIDSSKGLVKGAELVTGDNSTFTNSIGSWYPGISCTLAVENGRMKIDQTGINGRACLAVSCTIGDTLEVEGDIENCWIGISNSNDGANNATFNNVVGAGRKVYRSCTHNPMYITVGVNGNVTGSMYTDNIKARIIAGNCYPQYTSSYRPTWQLNPHHIKYDAGQSLNINFEAAPGICTIARSIPGVGAQISYPVDINTATYVDNVTSCVLLIIPRELTAEETYQLTKYLDEKAGVPPTYNRLVHFITKPKAIPTKRKKK